MKQKKAMMFEYEDLKKKTVAKYKKISFIDLEDRLETKQREYLIEKAYDEKSQNQKVTRSNFSNL
jgi:hypothetical protein